MKQKNQTITIAVASESSDSVKRFMDKMEKSYCLSEFRSISKNGIYCVKCKINIYEEIRKFMELVATDLDIDRESIFNWKCKKRKQVFARDIISFILRNRYKLSYPRIAELTGAVSHASAMLSCRKFDSTNLRIEGNWPELAYTKCKYRYLKGVAGL